ncbi:MAG: acetyl-CoA carboxylase carboxyltransferase subunit alpha [Saprospiraceae bacterium]|nr:acetyl-CoA carboxylase carboxyltransferase subunit alpha [Saprospiraceae bacterium]
MVFLEFEKPLEKLYEQLEKLRKLNEEDELDMTDKIAEIELMIQKKSREIYSNMSGWQKVQLSRHPQRPYAEYYIKSVTSKFIELHGDRYFKDDKAIVGGIGKIGNQSVVLIGQQKGENIKMRQYRNFGMANPDGYRKALRLMKLAEKFNYPVITFIDTPGAYPGIEAEERGQAEAIARNLFEMANLKTPIIVYVIGEGASGGALGIGVGDRIFMLENTWYSVISPENCSTILWRNWDHKEEAAEALKLTPEHMLQQGLIDEIIKEPLGGAHNDPEKMAKNLKAHIVKQIKDLLDLDTVSLLAQRVNRYKIMGHFTEI